MLESNRDTEIRDGILDVETRLLGCLRKWRLPPEQEVNGERTLYQEICYLLELYIGACIKYGPRNVQSWWSDGIIRLEISTVHNDWLRLIGVTWIDSIGIAPFEIEFELKPNDHVRFSKTVFRLGQLDKSGHPIVCSQHVPAGHVLDMRPKYNRDWAIAVELTPPAEDYDRTMRCTEDA